MKKIIFTIAIAIAATAGAQTFTVHEKDGNTTYNPELVDSITFSETNTMPASIPSTTQITIDAHWCALGTSITYLNDYDKQGRFENPYLDYNKADEVRATNLQTAAGQAYALHQKAVVLMKNHENALPLTDTAKKVFIQSYTRSHYCTG
mgnify:CR=1 FL=1